MIEWTLSLSIVRKIENVDINHCFLAVSSIQVVSNVQVRNLLFNENVFLLSI